MPYKYVSDDYTYLKNKDYYTEETYFDFDKMNNSLLMKSYLQEIKLCIIALLLI